MPLPFTQVRAVPAFVRFNFRSRKLQVGIAVIVVLIYAILTALMSSRLFWHDELFTFYIASSPGWTRFRQALTLDLNPPLQYLAVRASIFLFGTNPYAVRLPFILAFLAGSLCIWRFVGKRLSTEYGLLALLVFWGSPFFYYATEARPYALMTGFIGVALLFWQRSIERDPTPATILALGAAVLGMMLTHLMGVVYIAPFCLAEVAHSWRLRRWRLGIWFALLAPCAVPFIYQHMLRRLEATAIPPVFQASVRKIAESYYGSLRLEALPLLIALVTALLVTRKTLPVHPDRSGLMSREDLALAIGFLITPALVNLALLPVHGAYFDRYALPVAFGYGFLIAFFLALQTSVSRMAAGIASSILLLFICLVNLGPHLKRSVWTRSDAAISSGRSFEQVRPDLPLVAASGLTFIEMDHYENPETVSRLYYLTDTHLALQYAGATMFESLGSLKQYFPIRAQVVPFKKFAAEHHTFLVLGTPDYPEDWLLRALVATPAHVRYLGNFTSTYKDSQLFEVTLP